VARVSERDYGATDPGRSGDTEVGGLHRTFSTPEDAAAGGPGELITLWDGLGYNRRALLLHKCAVAITHDHGGQFPADLQTLLSLPGVGPYTARAVLAFAFEADVAVVDTNVGRVLARMTGAPLSPAGVQAIADRLVPDDAGWEWNQALLDFGALVCTKRSPTCADCPVLDLCSWAGRGIDPAVGSAAVSEPQSRFDGSDRQGRGRLVARLRSETLPVAVAINELGFGDDDERAQRVLASLVHDGLIVQQHGSVRLP
jgi:A/G-specific adenine glycosylase